ncbi:GNAT family N-acetyltransferase [Halomonas sp. H10-9-1]|uniref:GNAT family N-acetyltransferase n=1 Tax=Halomonas sp. H10-9-1 TaxID=2950871 RepID=UPI0032DF381C
MSVSSQGGKAVRLSVADLSAVVALEAAHNWPMSGSEAQLRIALADPATALFGVAVGSTLEAYASVVRLPFEAELQAILVDASRRGKGLGRRLLGVVVDQAREWGSERLLLEVRAGNASAIALYRAVGFREDGIRRGYYPPLPCPPLPCPPRPSEALHAPEMPPRRTGAVREDALLMSLALG